MNNNQKRKKIGSAGLVFISVILVAIVSISMFAYAKYIAERNGTATAQIAEMKFKINDSYYQSTDVIQFSTTITKQNPKVANNLVAPGTAGEIPIIIDASESQTSLEYEINIELTNRPPNLKFYSDNTMTNEIVVNNDKITRRGYISIEPNSGSTTVDETIYWDWPTETGENKYEIAQNDQSDSDYMNKLTTMKIDVKGTQVKEKPVYLGEKAKVGDIVNYKAPGQSESIRFRVVNITSNQVEMMPVTSNGIAILGRVVRLGYQTAESTNTIKMQDAIKSYNNAIMDLDQAAISWFSNKYGYNGATRALRISDVNNLTGYTPNPSSDYTNGKIYTTDAQIFIVDGLTKVITTNGEEIQATDLEGIQLGDTVVIGNTYGDKTIASVKIKCNDGENTNAWYNYLDYSPGVTTNPLNYFDATMVLANRTVKLNDDSSCSFCIRAYYRSSNSVGSFTALTSNGSSNYGDFAVVSVVSLPSKLHVTMNSEEWNIID